MAKWEVEIDILNDKKLSDLEKMVAIEMLYAGYDYMDKADVEEFWSEKLK